MKKATVALVAVMVVLAGCSGGGGTATQGTETTSDDTMDGNTNVEQPNVSEALSSLNTSDSELFANATSLDMTVYNGSEQTSVLIQNDSSANTELIQFSRQSTTTTFYNTTDYTALRNSSSGEIRYGEPGGNLGFGVAFGAAIFIFVGISYAGFVEWQEGGTTTVDGETAFVYEADSLNQTALNRNTEGNQNFSPNFDQGSVDSVDGEMIISADGQLQSINIDIRRSGERYGVDFSVNYDPVTIEKPDWVDESEAQAQTE